jgi:Homeodomain-like domain
MIDIDFTPEDIEALHHERFHHPHPPVQEKMEAVYLKSQGLLHKEICRLSRTSENTLRSYLRHFQEGGVERLKRLLKFVKKDCLSCRYYEDFIRLKAAIVELLEEVEGKHKPSIRSLPTLNFQTFEEPKLLAG